MRTRTWDENDLERRLCHALEIARQAVTRLAKDGYTDPKEPANSVRPEKVISETALLLYAASTAAHRETVKERIAYVAEVILPFARSERMALGLCLEPALAMDFAQAHVLLARIGYPDRDFDELLRQAGESQARGGRERPPHRMLEQDWIDGIWKGAKPRRRSHHAKDSVLGRPMDLLGGGRDDVYAFTHALMYVTDFQVRSVRLPRPRPVILAEAETALARCLDEQDYDLAGEVLLAWPLTGKSWSPPATFGFRVLARVEDQAGFLPASSTRLDRLSELSGGERTDYFLATAYHTAYVMGLLCAAALLPDRTPPVETRRAPAVPGSASRLLRFIESENPGHWRVEFDRLPQPEQDSLAGLLLSMALRQRAIRREFEAVHELLRIGYDLNLADAPAPSQAAEMLSRLAALTTTLKRNTLGGLGQNTA